MDCSRVEKSLGHPPSLPLPLLPPPPCLCPFSAEKQGVGNVPMWHGDQVLQCVAVWCRELQRVVESCRELQSVTECCSVLQCVHGDEAIQTSEGCHVYGSSFAITCLSEFWSVFECVYVCV